MLTELPFLDHGLVRVRDVMGSDLTVVNAARVSFDASSDWERVQWIPGEEAPIGYTPVSTGPDTQPWTGKRLKPKDERLIHFLAEGGHWSPFAHPQISLEIYVPGMVLDQLVKHRIGMIYSDEESFVAYENAADNQLSMRYREPQHFYIPDEKSWRSAPENKKQGSGPNIDWGNVGARQSANLRDEVHFAREQYDHAIQQGVAPEQARLFLPYYAMYTRRYWTTSLMGCIRFLQLREKPDAQYEIRQLANAVHKLIEPRFSVSFAAYGLTGGTNG